MHEQSTRQSLLEAAFFIVKEHGVGRLTLDFVAEKAVVSKGGLLYHFPNKRTLLEAMISSLIEGFNVHFYAEAARTDPLQAYVKISLVASQQPETAALIAAIASDMELLLPLKQAIQEWGKSLHSVNLPAVQINTIRMATDGLWFAEVFGLESLSPKRRKELVEYLLKLSRGTNENTNH